MPFASPTNTRPPNTVGVPWAAVTPGKPKAHLSLGFCGVFGVRPAACAFWKRVFPASAHPFHDASLAWVGGPTHGAPWAATAKAPHAINPHAINKTGRITSRS